MIKTTGLCLMVAIILAITVSPFAGMLHALFKVAFQKLIQKM